MRNCDICGKPVILVPSAHERARRYGGSSKEYESIFNTHMGCAIYKRSQESVELMRRLNVA